MADLGMLVDYEYCTGCHACEVACKQEHLIPAGKVGGVQVMELIHEFPGDKMYITYFPFFSKLCFFCAPRTKKGLPPACVQHCMAQCLTYGKLEELTKNIPRKRKTAIYTLSTNPEV